MKELIDKNDAIRIAEQGQVQGFEWQFKKLCNLPSEQPDVPDINVGEITDKKQYYSFKYVDEDGEEYIDYFIPPADLSDYCDKLWKLAYERGKAEGQPRKGKWIYGEHDVAMCDGYRCDKCGFFVPWDYQHKFIDFINEYNFCPNCGCRMEEGEYE